MKEYYSNGKLLLTGEYLVLDGAIALAVPTEKGQKLIVSTIEENIIHWKSYTNTNELWLETQIDISKNRLISATYFKDDDQFAAEKLLEIIQETKKLNPKFLKEGRGFLVETHLDFDRSWGLGSSSTLINNVAKWSEVNPYQLLENTFGGSGYDIACAGNNHPITYKLEGEEPKVNEISFDPSFKDQLYFVHLNQKQNSREGIARYKKKRGSISKEIEQISLLTQNMISSNTLQEFEEILKAHESIIAAIIQSKTIKELIFPDYFGEIKSLGAWGGDFVLATGNENTPDYFRNKGFATLIPYQEMVL